MRKLGIRKLSIRWRLTLWFGAAMTALLVARSFWIYFMMERRLTAATDTELNLELDSLEAQIRSASDEGALKQVLAEYTAVRRGLEIEVFDPQQNLLFGSSGELHDANFPNRAAKSGAAARDKSNRRRATNVLKEGVRRRSVAEEIPSAIGMLTVQIGRSMQTDENEAWAFAVDLLMTGPMVVLAALGVGYLVSSRALSPVDKMISAANEITAKRLERRIDVPNTGDELARLARTLNEMIDRLYKSFEEMRRFTADAAHDLRTPVAALRCAVEVSLMADRSTEEYRDSLQLVLDEAVHLSRLTTQLLDLSREDHGVHSGQQEHVRLDLVVQNALEDVDNTARQKQIVVDKRPIRPLTVVGDQVRLRRVFVNLLSNAVQYTPRGGKVWIEADFSPKWTTVVVADNGPGVPEEELPHVFDRFRRVDQARNRDQGGTGLGLAICKSIVEAHGGQITMQSTLGRGTRVIVKLPATEPSPVALVA